MVFFVSSIFVVSVLSILFGVVVTIGKDRAVEMVLTEVAKLEVVETLSPLTIVITPPLLADAGTNTVPIGSLDLLH